MTFKKYDIWRQSFTVTTIATAMSNCQSRKILPKLKEQSFSLVFKSPPYWAGRVVASGHKSIEMTRKCVAVKIGISIELWLAFSIHSRLR
jgi:16S rRNA G966 N2-methylase RsmD